MSRTDRLALAFVRRVTRRPWLVIGAILLLTAVAAVGGTSLEFSNNYREFFSPRNSELVAFEKFQATYTKNDNILFVVQPAEGSVLAEPNATRNACSRRLATLADPAMSRTTSASAPEPSSPMSSIPLATAPIGPTRSWQIRAASNSQKRRSCTASLSVVGSRYVKRRVLPAAGLA